MSHAEHCAHLAIARREHLAASTRGTHVHVEASRSFAPLACCCKYLLHLGYAHPCACTLSRLHHSCLTGARDSADRRHVRDQGGRGRRRQAEHQGVQFRPYATALQCARCCTQYEGMLVQTSSGCRHHLSIAVLRYSARITTMRLTAMCAPHDTHTCTHHPHTRAVCRLTSMATR